MKYEIERCLRCLGTISKMSLRLESSCNAIVARSRGPKFGCSLPHSVGSWSRRCLTPLRFVAREDVNIRGHFQGRSSAYRAYAHKLLVSLGYFVVCSDYSRLASTVPVLTTTNARESKNHDCPSRVGTSTVVRV
jgi:hypothetical protein